MNESAMRAYPAPKRWSRVTPPATGALRGFLFAYGHFADDGKAGEAQVLWRCRLRVERAEHHDLAVLATGSEQPTAAGVITAYDGKVVRLPGFVVPIDYDGTGIIAFILVPYVGACVHVPPPANRLVLVTTDRPHEVEAMWEPVLVSGRRLCPVSRQDRTLRGLTPT